LNCRENAHIAYHGRVYDISKFVASHPGGAEQILLGAGKDITLTFESYHSPNVVKILEKYYIGDLIDSEFPTFPEMEEFYKTLKQRVHNHNGFHKSPHDSKQATEYPGRMIGKCHPPAPQT